MKLTGSVILGGLIGLYLFWTEPTPEAHLKALMTQYKTLSQLPYRNDSLVQALNTCRHDIVTHIQEYGYLVPIRAPYSGSVVAIKAQPRDALHLTTLRHGDQLYVFERIDQHWVRVKTTDDVHGYLEHQDFIPALDSFPLNLFDALPESAPSPPQAAPVAPPQAPTPTAAQNTPKQATSGSSCTATRCRGWTQSGRRCRRKTTNCNGHCWQH